MLTVDNMTREQMEERNQKYAFALKVRTERVKNIRQFTSQFEDGLITQVEFLEKINRLFISEDFIDYAIKNPI